MLSVRARGGQFRRRPEWTKGWIERSASGERKIRPNIVIDGDWALEAYEQLRTVRLFDTKFTLKSTMSLARFISWVQRVQHDRPELYSIQRYTIIPIRIPCDAAPVTSSYLFARI